MKTDQTPFSTGWMSFELPGYRDCDGTYCFFQYDELPALDEMLFKGDFGWLTKLTPDLAEAMNAYKQVEAGSLQDKHHHLLASAQETGVTLPASFVKFMQAPGLQDQIPSSTACYFDLSDHLLSNPTGEAGYLVRFMNDQQDLLFWYLYLNPAGDHCVLVSSAGFDSEEAVNFPPDTIGRSVAFCAPGFEAFLYRWWLENSIWFALEEGRPLTEEQARYARHFEA